MYDRKKIRSAQNVTDVSFFVVFPPFDSLFGTVNCPFSPRESVQTSSVHPNPPATLTVHPIDRLQLAAVAKESLDRVQLTAIDRSLGFSNA